MTVDQSQWEPNMETTIASPTTSPSPGVSPATVRLVLNELCDARVIEPRGSGPGARWRRRLASKLI